MWNDDVRLLHYINVLTAFIGATQIKRFQNTNCNSDYNKQNENT